jgi:5-methylcytosine-specific restriction endonuclease McrA
MRAGDENWHRVFERDKGRCRYCDMDLLCDFEHYQMSSIDHIKSRAANGVEDDVNNMVLACNGCNARLSRAKDLTTFQERRDRLRSPAHRGGAGKRYDEYLDLRENAWVKGEEKNKGAEVAKT